MQGVSEVIAPAAPRQIMDILNVTRVAKDEPARIR